MDTVRILAVVEMETVWKVVKIKVGSEANVNILVVTDV